jgi:hypothetical protein
LIEAVTAVLGLIFEASDVIESAPATERLGQRT